jgi:hypothetical protein
VNRLTVGGTATDPVFDISSSYVGQATITTLGTVTTGVWNATSIGTAYTDAKVVSLSGVSNRTTITGTATVPIVDISATYVGQTSITTLGTIATGAWNGTRSSGPPTRPPRSCRRRHGEPHHRRRHRNGSDGRHFRERTSARRPSRRWERHDRRLERHVNRHAYTDAKLKTLTGTTEPHHHRRHVH